MGSTFNLGPDVIYNDYNLAAIPSADYVEALLGTSISTLQMMADYKVNSLSDPKLEQPSSANNYNAGKIIYVNGNAKIDSSVFPGGPTKQFGTSAVPTILIVKGDLDMSANFDFYGIIIANNVVGASGTSIVTGSVITNNVNNVSGNLTLAADPSLSIKLGNLVKRTTISNSWRDWE